MRKRCFSGTGLVIVPFGLLLMQVSAPASVIFHPAEKGEWAWEGGVALITSNTIQQLFEGEVNVEDGPKGGEIYMLAASKKLGEFEWQVGNSVFRPQVEMPLMLEIVDEKDRSPFADYNASLVIRWVDFPWNSRHVTTVASGVGLSYSSKVYGMDRQRHPDRDRSHLKFNWPLQFTLAHPSRPQDQAMFFILHQSGGRLLDRGGVNSVGMGYPRGF